MENVNMRELLNKLTENDRRVDEAANPSAEQMVFRALDRYYTTLDGLDKRLVSGLLGSQMNDLGLDAERGTLLHDIRKILSNLEDILPGLEMGIDDGR